MELNKSNIYNNLINLTRNKKIYKYFTDSDTFNDRLVIYLLHLSFFFARFKSKDEKVFLQSFFDYSFRQIETSIREVGHGDVTVNKKMKEYINYFYFIVDKTKNWNLENNVNKIKIIQKIIDIEDNSKEIVNYIDNYVKFLSNSTLNSFSKSVIDEKF